ncbi:MAG: choice-of-anchor D domain-containing protein [Gammaproteobacteria bacterium]|nr:choice-of-anchor D domain-containing protein [Gammaproteobacteria bacterium]
MKSIGSLYFAGLCIVSLLSACGGGGSGSESTQSGISQPVSEPIQIVGAGIKGPLAFADAKIYRLDPSFSEFYDVNNPISSAITNASAQITGLSVPADSKPPYILTIGGNSSIDLNTGKAPVINTLVTVITADMLSGNQPIYTTPLTTLAFHMARHSSSLATSTTEFVSKLRNAAPKISSLFAIDPTVNIDIFSSPLVINASTVTVAEQKEAVHHRAALEAFAAKVYILSFKPENANADEVIDRLALDIQSDGVINNAANGKTIGGIDATVMNRDPMVMTIPNTGYQVSDITTVMSEERILIGTSSESEFLINEISLPAPEPVIIEPTPSIPPTSPTPGTPPAVTPVPPVQPIALPFDLQNAVPEEASLTVNVTKPGEAETATISIGVYDADHSNEGELIINGNPPVSLFGAQGVSTNNVTSTNISINTPASYWNTGDNTLLFRHTSSGGFVIEDVAVSFQTASAPLLEPVLTLSTNSLNFGFQNVGTVSNTSPVLVTNNGTASLTISSITTSQGFVQSNDCSSTIAAGDSCTVNVSFIPTISGATSGNLNISSNSQGSQNSVALSGTGDSTTSSPSNLISSGPVVIDGQQGVVISGLRISNPDGNCIDIRGGSTNIVIENSEIGPCAGKGIYIIQSTNVDVRNNVIRDTVEEAVMSYESSSIAVDANVIENVQSGYEMWTTNGGNLSFTNNYVKNVTRDQSGNGGGGNIVQMVYARGPGIRVTNNIGINVLGESYPEDLINVYKSSGTASDPILISGNKFLGGGPSPSGGGIILGDQGGSYQIAENNILVNPGQYGMQIAGGSNNTIRNNQIFSDDKRDFANGGIIVWRYNDIGTGTQPGNCYGHTVVSNQVTWWKGPNYKNNGSPAIRNASWLPGYGSDNVEPNCGTVAGWDNNDFDTDSSQPANLDMSLWNTAWDIP